jgi:hypothetical protein
VELDDYRNLLVRHLLPFFAELRLTEITYEKVLEYRAERLRTSRALHDAAANGFALIEHDQHGRPRPRRLFAARQINASIALLAQILSRAVKSESYALCWSRATARAVPATTSTTTSSSASSSAPISAADAAAPPRCRPTSRRTCCGARS